jgi:phage tail sheath gpL-like
MAISTAVDLTAVARVVGIQTAFKDLRGSNILFLPQSVGIVGQGSTASTFSTTKARHTSAFSVGSAYGFGSPVHLAAKQLLPANGDGIGTIPLTVYPLEDDDEGVAAAGDITPSGTPTVSASYRVRISGQLSAAFVIAVGDSVADRVTAMTDAINANLDMPVIASDDTTEVGITAKWKGASGNDIFIEIIGSTTAGNSFAITQPTGGLVNPDVQSALDQIGDVWEVNILNCLEVADTTALDAYNTFGEGRWGALTRKPCLVFTGGNEATVSSATTVSDARKTDRVNVLLNAPGSPNLPLEIAARQLARIVKVAQADPARDFGSQSVSGIIPGTDAQQWTYPDKDLAVKSGASTVDVKDGVVTISDVVTMYHPTGDPTPGYRYVCDFYKVATIIFNLNYQFVRPEWDGAPLIPDDQATVNPNAKQPRSAVAVVCAMIDQLGLAAIISDPETAKKNTFAAINDQNPKRLDLSTTIQISGNVNILSIDFNFGFYFGSVVA